MDDDKKEREIRFAEKKVDDSWKESINREKEAVPSRASGSTDAPPGSIQFIDYLTSLGMQVLLQLGLVPHPQTGQREKNLDAAREIIDLLMLLKEKTKGNLNGEEETVLKELLADLQIRFVENSK